MSKVYLVNAARTPIGSFQGMFSSLSGVELGVSAVQAAIERAGLKGKEELIDEVNLGCIYQHGQGQGVARQVSIHSGIPVTTPAVTTNILCGSGLFSVIQGARAILCGDANLVVSGGTESMTNAPFILKKARGGYRMGHGEVLDSMLYDGLTDVFNQYHMGVTAENLAKKYSLTREEQDEFALSSQHKAQKAIEAGRFKDEIVPVTVKNRKGDQVFEQDEYPRLNCSIESLQKLRPAFDKQGSVTAGNSSGINDGAAALVLASEEMVQEHGLKPMAEIVSFAVSGCEPSIMGIGPVEAVRKTLKKSGDKLEDMELIEANEAFAAQSIAVGKDLDWNPEIVNVNGGAIALGHPVGASGARILVTLLFEMQKREVKNGLATLCVGGGMGVSLQVRRV